MLIDDDDDDDKEIISTKLRPKSAYDSV